MCTWGYCTILLFLHMLTYQPLMSELKTTLHTNVCNIILNRNIFSINTMGTRGNDAYTQTFKEHIALKPWFPTTRLLKDCELCTFTPKTLRWCLFSASPIHLWMVQTGLWNCLSLNSPLFNRLFLTLNYTGVTRVVANIISRRRQLGELCCGSSPWRDSTPFPPKTWMSVVFVL